MRVEKVKRPVPQEPGSGNQRLKLLKRCFDLKLPLLLIEQISRLFESCKGNTMREEQQALEQKAEEILKMIQNCSDEEQVIKVLKLDGR